MIPILRSFFTKLFRLGSETGPLITSGTGDPNTNIPAPIGSLYLREDGAVNTTVYSKTSDNIPDQGWTPLSSSAAPPSSVKMSWITVDFGYPMAKEKTFSIDELSITENTTIVAQIMGSSKDFGMDEIVCTANPYPAGSGFFLHVKSLTGRIGGEFNIAYLYQEI